MVVRGPLSQTPVVFFVAILFVLFLGWKLGASHLKLARGWEAIIALSMSLSNNNVTAGPSARKSIVLPVCLLPFLFFE